MYLIYFIKIQLFYEQYARRNSQQNQQENEHQSDKHLRPKIDSKESDGVIHSAHSSSTK